MAHEIAVRGYPTHADDPRASVFQFSVDAPQFADLVGMIARSHGMSLRSTLAYLEQQHFNALETRTVHPVFLMALLRIADYLHLHAERAPTSQLAIQKLRSPVSKREWEAHRAIYDIRLDTEADPEALAVDVSSAELAHVSTYLRIREWVSGLQAELDSTWAVLGEVYGRHERLRNLWLSIRRIRSNLDKSTFQAALPFRPVHAAFEAADAELLKLLIRPLYGDDPAIGLRELIQNATDAVRELAVYKEKLGHKNHSPEILHPDYPEADVLVWLRKRGDISGSAESPEVPAHWQQWIEVRDRGIGMSGDTVRDYFLRAGASFRYSDVWRKNFERDSAQNDEAPRSTVLRSGRFGIGALAAFLLGDEIQVSTKYVADEGSEGVLFTAELETRDIQLSRFKGPTGTTVRVRLDERIDQGRAWRYRLDFDHWYCLTEPLVIQLHPTGEVAEQYYTVPGPQEELPSGWHRIVVPGYLDIQWTYRYTPNLTCNGIRVKGDVNDLTWTRARETIHRSPEHHLAVPNVSVFDPDGRLPLNLARTGLATTQYPFEKELLRDVLRDYIAFVLVHAPSKPLVGNHAPQHNRVAYPGLGESVYGRRLNAGVHWVSLKQGITIPDASLVRAAGVRRMLVLVRRRKGRWVPSFDLSGTGAIFGFDTDTKSQNFFSRLWPLRERNFCPYDGNPLYDLAIVGARAVLPKRAAEAMLMTEKAADQEETAVSTEAEHGKFVLWQTGIVPPGDTLLVQLMQRQSVQRHERDVAGIVEWYLRDDLVPYEPTELFPLWMELIGKPYIPYDPVQRETELHAAFHELRDYIDAWRTTRYENSVAWRHDSGSDDDYDGDDDDDDGW